MPNPGLLRAEEEQLAALLPDETECGPAMKLLTDRMKMFVIATFASDSRGSATAAARLAGYKDNPNALKVTAHRLAHDSRIQAAILEEASRRMQFGTAMATTVLHEILLDTGAAHKDRLKAAAMILDRGGLHAMTEHKVSVEHTMGRDEKLLKLADLALSHGLDPKTLLGSLTDVSPKEREVIEGKLLGKSTEEGG